jgi:soluble lytic murein transglycosylase-like protein
MNIKSIPLNYASFITSGISASIIFFIIILSYQGHKKISPVIIRPIQHKIILTPIRDKIDIADTDSSNYYLNPDETNKDPFYSAIIIKAADKHDVDPALIKAIIMTESRYNPMATSEKGAMGLMQIMPSTASAFSTEDMYDPVNNINVGVEYLKNLIDQFEGDLGLALAAYNAGSSTVRKYRGIPPYEETRYFVYKVLENYSHYQEG